MEKIKILHSILEEETEYHMEGAAYGGLRIDIDKYYQDESNRKKLEEINNSAFGNMFDEKGNKKQELQESSSTV